MRTLETLNLDDGAGPGAQRRQGVAHVQEAQREQRAVAGSGRIQTAEDQGRTARNHAESEDQGNAAGLILTALQRLGTNTPDTWIAREVGCSRKTVARWRKRFQEQGRLSAAAERDQQDPDD